MIKLYIDTISMKMLLLMMIMMIIIIIKKYLVKLKYLTENSLANPYVCTIFIGPMIIGSHYGGKSPEVRVVLINQHDSLMNIIINTSINWNIIICIQLSILIEFILILKFISLESLEDGSIENVCI